MPRQTADDEDFDPYHKWLGIPKDQRPPTHYQLLGISPNEEDNEAIEAAAARQKLFIQEFRKGPRSRTATSILFQVEEAKVTLLNPTMRDAYDQRLGIHREYRRTFKGTSAGASDFGSGSNSIGESGGFLKDYAVYVGILTTAFLVMAVAAFYLPWGMLSGAASVVATKPIPSLKPALPMPVSQAPAQQREEPKPSVPLVARAETKPQEKKPESENLLKGLDIANLTKHGRWKLESEALESESNPSPNWVLISHEFPERYSLQVDYTILAGPAVVMSIPVGRSRLRVALLAKSIELSEVANEAQRQARNKTADYWHQPKEISFKQFSNGREITSWPSIRYSALIEVKKDGNDISIRIQQDDKGEILWKGPESDLSEGTNADFWAKRDDILGSFRGLAIGTFQGSSVRLQSVKVLPLSDDSTKVEPHSVRLDSSKKVEAFSVELPDTPNHKAAMWILEQQGQLEVTNLGINGELGRVVSIYRKEDLPHQNFRITKINFYKRPTEDSHLRKLADMPVNDVFELNLMETKVSDVGLQHVAKMKNLRKLNIAATKVNGTGFRYLTEIKYLRELFCGGAPIQDSSLRYLKDFPSLSILGLIDTKVTDEGTVDLSQVSTLTELRMNGTKLTDRGLANLLTLNGLKILSVSNTKVSQKAINAIRKRNPSCVVNW